MSSSLLIQYVGKSATDPHRCSFSDHPTISLKNILGIIILYYYITFYLVDLDIIFIVILLLYMNVPERLLERF